MSHGIRPPGKWNEACVNMKKFTSPEALQADFHRRQDVYGVWGSLLNIFIFCNVR